MIVWEGFKKSHELGTLSPQGGGGVRHPKLSVPTSLNVLTPKLSLIGQSAPIKHI